LQLSDDEIILVTAMTFSTKHGASTADEERNSFAQNADMQSPSHCEFDECAARIAVAATAPTPIASTCDPIDN
jgi:hypothetical protein